MEKQNQIIDMDALLAYCQGNQSMVDRLVKAYIETQAQYLIDTEKVVSEQNVPGTRAMCHKLIGAAKTVRALKVVAAIDKLRSEATNEDWLNASNAMAELRGSFSELAETIEK